MSDTTQKGDRARLIKLLEGPQDMATPDLTKAQVAAVVQAGAAIAVILGIEPTDVQTAAIAGLSGIVGIVLPTADAAIRRERARQAKQIGEVKAKQKLKAPATPPLAVLRAELDSIVAATKREQGGEEQQDDPQNGAPENGGDVVGPDGQQT